MEAFGYSGGIWVLWNENYKAYVEYTHPQFIIMDIQPDNEERKSIAFVYGSPSQTLRRKLWSELSRRNRNMVDAWLCVGDFNSVTVQEEVSNWNTFNSQRCSDFTSWIF